MSQTLEVQGSHYPVPNPRKYQLTAKAFEPYLQWRGVRVNGLDNLPPTDQPYVIASSHRGELDPPVLGNVLLNHDATQIHFVAKKELWELHEKIEEQAKKAKVGRYIAGLVGRHLGDAMIDLMDGTGSIMYDRPIPLRAQPQADRSMSHVLKHEGVLCIFIEATRKSGLNVVPEKAGYSHIATRDNAPIVPISIDGTESYLGPIYMEIGKPIAFGGIDPDDRRAGIKRLRQMEEECLETMNSGMRDARWKREEELFDMLGSRRPLKRKIAKTVLSQLYEVKDNNSKSEEA